MRTDDSGSITDEEILAITEGKIRVVCACTIDPHFWADLRSDEKIDSDPKACPDGRTDFDLETQDFEALYDSIIEFSNHEKQKEDIAPLSEAGPAS